MKFQIFDERHREQQTGVERKIVMPSSTFGILRRQLVKNLGKDRIQDVLFSFGYEMGSHDGKKALLENKSIEYLIKYGPLLHIENGHIEGIVHQCDVEMDESGRAISVVGQGHWYGSYEAKEHLQWVGPSDKPVCFTLIGYASGFMSQVFGEPLVAKELTCIGKGDESCSWIIKTQRQWEIESSDQVQIQNVMTIEKELKYTYDQLLEQRNFIKKLSDFQTIVADEVANGNDLYHLSNIAYEAINIPLVINNYKSQSLLYVGMSEKKFMLLEEDFAKHIEAHPFDNIFAMKSLKHSKVRTIQTGKQTRLAAPVIVHNQLLAWCFFIYEANTKALHENDSLFLDRFANTASIVLLNEKTKFESFERMKGNFLEQLLNQSISEKEMLQRGLFAGIDLTQEYYVTLLEFISYNQVLFEEFEIKEQLLEYAFEYFNDCEMNVIVGHRDGRIVILIPTSSINCDIQIVVKRFYQALKKNHINLKLKFGISSKQKAPSNVQRAFDEGEMAIRLTFNRDVAMFERLGIVGVFLKESNISWVRQIAQQELKALYDFNDIKNVELLKTLYIFLINGGNLDKTKIDLNLSLSGLRHRLQKIEQVLDKNIRAPEVMYQLLLILKSLIVAGDFSIHDSAFSLSD